MYESLVNDCVDPCLEYGENSSYCEQFGCPAADTTTMQTTSTGVQTSAVGLGLSADGMTYVTVTVIVVVLIFVLVVVIWRYRRRRRRSSINDAGMTYTWISTLLCYDL